MENEQEPEKEIDRMRKELENQAKKYQNLFRSILDIAIGGLDLTEVEKIAYMKAEDIMKDFIEVKPLKFKGKTLQFFRKHLKTNPKIKYWIDLLDFLKEEAKDYRLKCKESIIKNKHMNELGKMDSGDEILFTDPFIQRIIDAILVDFINVIAGKQCIDLALYTSDLK